MPRFDLSPPELESYRPDIREPEDFDAFWADTNSPGAAIGGDVVVDPGATPHSPQIDVFDVTFPGFGGDPVKAWLWASARRAGPLPAVVEYIGYGGGRGLPHERLTGPPRATRSSSWTPAARARAGAPAARRRTRTGTGRRRPAS